MAVPGDVDDAATLRLAGAPRTERRPVQPHLAGGCRLRTDDHPPNRPVAGADEPDEGKDLSAPKRERDGLGAFAGHVAELEQVALRRRPLGTLVLQLRAD